MSTADWIVVSLAACPAAVVLGVLLTWSIWTGGAAARRAVPALLAVHTGGALLLGAVATSAAVRSWQVVGRAPEEQAAALLEVSRIDGDTSMYALLVLVLITATVAVTGLLAMAARFAASHHPVDRSIACAVLGAEIGVCGVGLARLAGGSRAITVVVAVAHLPVLMAAMVACWPPPSVHHAHAPRHRTKG